jgi:hypothetical protein
MKNRMFGSLRAVLGGLLAGALFSSAAMAATSDSVDLSGTVASTLAISVLTLPAAGALDLDGVGVGSASQHIVNVADVTLTTNTEAGLTLTVSSGDLEITAGVGSPISYQVATVAGGAAAPGVLAFSASGTPYTSNSIAGTLHKDLYIMYTPADLQTPGDYIATITLSVLDN